VSKEASLKRYICLANKAHMRSSKTSVADIISEMKPWVDELMLLREIILSSGLNEEIKWGGPIYTLDGKNVLAIGGFRNLFPLSFREKA